jgi:hypothetical protein
VQNISHKIASVQPLEKDFAQIGLDKGSMCNDDVGSLSEPLMEKKYRRTPKKTRTKRTTATDRREWRRKKRLPKAKTKARKRLRKPMVKKRQKLLMKWKERRNIPKKPAGRAGRIRLSLAAGKNGRAANLMEEVQEIVTSIESTQQEEVIKAYAQQALVADELSEKFLAMAEAIAEAVDQDDISEEEASAIEGLAELSEQFDGVANEAADSAEALYECAQQGAFHEEVELDKVEEHFKGLMSMVLDGCDIYASLTEDDEDPEVGEDESDLQQEVYDKHGKASAAKRSKNGKGKHGVPKMRV